MKPKSLLLIGGTGFFGNSILKYFLNSKSLKKKFNKIIIISRKKFQKFDYIKKLKKNYQIVKKNYDVLKLKKLPLADYVIYAAILKNYKNDYLAVKNYTNLAKRYHKQSRILYVSSGAVYGVQPNNIKSFKEDYLKYNKKIHFKKGYKKNYSNFKLKSEKLFQELGNSGLKVSIARCFTFVGEFLSLNSNFVIGNIIKNVLDNRAITIRANYKIYRSYMYSDDLVQSLLKILNDSDINCPIYNVGSSNAISIQKVTKILGKKYNLKVNIPQLTNKTIDVYVPNVNKFEKKFKFKNSYRSLQAVENTIQLCLKKISNENK
jgi:nucleoside-diphosphate-sugar epimerase